MLGVDSVVTPVRRSLRLHSDYHYVASTQDMENSPCEPETTDDKARLAKLLSEHGFAYVPNKVNSQPMLTIGLSAKTSSLENPPF